MSLLGKVIASICDYMAKTAEEAVDRSEKRLRDYEKEAARRNYEFSDEQYDKLCDVDDKIYDARDKIARCREKADMIRNGEKERNNY